MAYKDIEKAHAAQRAWCVANRERINAANRARYAAGAGKGGHAANPEKVRAARRARYAANPEKYNARNNARCAANREKMRERYRAYRAANPEKINALNAKRNAVKLQAIPLWADFAKVASIYKFAQKAGMAVDHIVPLQNKLVCGLHCPDNLQLLAPYDNQLKTNRFDPFTHVHILPELVESTGVKLEERYC